MGVEELGTQRVEIFTKLALKQRFWTADRRRRHGLDAHDDCWLCDQEHETTDHMLVKLQLCQRNLMERAVVDGLLLHFSRTYAAPPLVESHPADAGQGETARS